MDSSIVVKNLLEEGVIVRNMKFWGIENFIRISIGTEKENKRLLKVLGKIL